MNPHVGGFPLLVAESIDGELEAIAMQLEGIWQECEKLGSGECGSIVLPRDIDARAAEAPRLPGHPLPFHPLPFPQRPEASAPLTDPQLLQTKRELGVITCRFVFGRTVEARTSFGFFGGFQSVR